MTFMRGEKMKKETIKKFVATMLCAAMVLSMAACGSTEPAATTAAATEAATTAAATAAATTAAATAAAAAETTAAAATNEEHPNWLCDEKQTISIMTYDSVSASYLPPSNDLYFWQWMEDQTNVHIDWDITPYASYGEVTQARLAAGEDFADILVIGGSIKNKESVIKEAGENGLFLDWSEKWDECAKNIHAYWQNDTRIPYETLMKDANGKVWGIYTTAAPQNNRITALWNKDWMDKLGLEVPETLDDFYNVLKAFKEAGDINGNGLADEIPMTTAGMAYLMSYMCSPFNIHEYSGSEYTNYWAEDGVIIDERLSDNMKTCLTFINKLYKEGLLDPEIFSASDNFELTSSRSAENSFGCMIMFAEYANSYGELVANATGADKTAENLIVGTALRSQYNGNKIMQFMNTAFSGQITCVTKDCKNPDLAMKWLDFAIASPDALAVRCRGKEGETWEYGADGVARPIYKADGTWSITDLGCGQVAITLIQTDEQLNFSKDKEGWFMKRVNHLTEVSEWFGAPIPKIPMLPEEQELVDMSVTDVATYWNEMRDKFCRGDADINAEWGTFVDTMKALGEENMVKAYQMVYDRTYKN